MRLTSRTSPRDNRPMTSATRCLLLPLSFRRRASRVGRMVRGRAAGVLEMR